MIVGVDNLFENTNDSNVQQTTKQSKNVDDKVVSKYLLALEDKFQKEVFIEEDRWSIETDLLHSNLNEMLSKINSTNL